MLIDNLLNKLKNLAVNLTGNQGEVTYKDGSGSIASNSQGKYHPTEEAWTYGYRTGTVGNNSIISGGEYGSRNEASGSRSNVGGGINNSALADRTNVNGGGNNTVNNSFSCVGGGNGNTVSGSDAVISGGNGNTVNNYRGLVSGGGNNTINGNESNISGGSNNETNERYAGITNGNRGNAYLYAQRVFSNGGFSSLGTCQTSEVLSNNTTSDSTTTTLHTDGSSRHIRLPNNTTWLYKIRLVARRTDADGENAAWLFEGIIQKDGTNGSTAIVTDSDTKTALVTTTWDGNVVADTTNGALQINVTGESGKTINWVAKVELVEVGG